MFLVAQLGGIIAIAFQHSFDLHPEHGVACLIESARLSLNHNYSLAVQLCWQGGT